jgi:hypothetical protein
MRRLNLMLEVLTDPVKRAIYDESIAPPRALTRVPHWVPEENPVRSEETHRVRFAVRHWFWVSLGTMLAIVGIWYGTSHEPPAVQPELTAARSGAVQTPSGRPAPTVADPQPALRREEPEPELSDSPVLRALSEHGPSGSLQAIENRSEGKELAEVPNVAMPDLSIPETEPLLPAPEVHKAKMRLHTGFAGRWLYAAGPSPKTEQGRYIAADVELVLTQDQGNLTGTYWGRYRSSDQATSPEVRFRLKGPAPSGTQAKLRWTSSDGAQGEAELQLLSGSLMTLNWWATKTGDQTGLASGTARLVRQANP